MKDTAICRLKAFVSIVLGMIFLSYVAGKDLYLILILAAAAGLVFSGGIILGLSGIDNGKVANFEDLNDGVYTYLDRIEDVFILKHVNKDGQKEKFAVIEVPLVSQGTLILKAGESFRKVENRIIALN